MKIYRSPYYWCAPLKQETASVGRGEVDEAQERQL